MREDIIVRDENGEPVYDGGDLVIDFSKAIGKYYGRGFFTNCDARYRVYEGARSTKKSYNMIGYELVLKIVMCEFRNVVVIRQNDVDNRQSTFEQICFAIQDLGFSHKFTARKQPLEIEYTPTGQKIIFRGLNNPTSLNSIKFPHGYWTDTYYEEAYEIESYDDFRKVDGSMRGRLPEGYFFQNTLCLNAWSQDTWIYDTFFKGRLEDDYNKLDDPKTKYMDFYDPDFRLYGRGLYLHKSTYKCNEFRDPDYDNSAAEMKRKAPEIYKVEFLGMWGNATESVYPEFNGSLVRPIQSFVGKTNGVPNKRFYSFAIGVDVGLSNGMGKRLTVKKNEKPSEKVGAATTMCLVAITDDYEQICVVDEYFHSNNARQNASNTDGDRNDLNLQQQCEAMIRKLQQWEDMYSESGLMRGTVNVFVDNADTGFRDALEQEAHRLGFWHARFYASSKAVSIQSRVDFERIMMAYSDFLVSDKCPNLERELKFMRRGEKGEARADGSDHITNGMEYALIPLLPDLKRWKTFKQR